MATPSINKLLEPFVIRYSNGEYEAVELGRKIKVIIDEQSQRFDQIQFSSLLTKFTQNGLELFNYSDPRDVNNKNKIIGLTILDCLLDFSDEIKPERRLEVINNIYKILENEKLPLHNANSIVLKMIGMCIGHLARIAQQFEIDYLQRNICEQSLKSLTEFKSDSRRYASAIILTQLAVHSPALIFGRKKQLFNNIWEVVGDKNSLVRSSVSELLETSFQLVSQRESMTNYIISALKQIESGLTNPAVEKVLGGLMILEIIVKGNVVTSIDFNNVVRSQSNLLQPPELISKVMGFLGKKDVRDEVIRHKVIEIIPNLAVACSSTFVNPQHNFLNSAIRLLLDMINYKKERYHAYLYLGKLFVAMANHLKNPPIPLISEIYASVCNGFKDPFCTTALQCLGMIVNVCTVIRKQVDVQLIELMFRGGLTTELVDNLKIMLKVCPHIRSSAQNHLRSHITNILMKYDVLIEDTGRPQSRIAGQRAQLHSPTIINAVDAPKSDVGKFFGARSMLFGVMKSDTAASNAAAHAAAIAINGNGSGIDVNVLNAEEELIFALQVLTSIDFFPKQLRDRSVKNHSYNEPIEEDQSLALLEILVESVVRYLDDYQPFVRGTAAQTSAAVLDAIVLSIDSNADEYKYFHEIIDRLLIMGVGDDSKDIRKKIFISITPALDHLVCLSENVHCVAEAVNDEDLSVRSASMTVLSRVAHYDPLHIMPIVRLTMKRLILSLQSKSSDNVTKKESVQLLQSLVKGSDSLIVPYVGQVMEPLLMLLNDPSPTVVVASLGTIGELAVASPESVRDHLDELLPRLIEALNDSTSLEKQEIAVVAMGKLVTSLTMVTKEPYKKYDGLFEGLVRAIQSVDDDNGKNASGGGSTELRLQAIKTLGLLGAVDVEVYQHHLTNQVGVIDAFSNQNDYVDNMDEEEQAVVNANDSEDKRLSKMEKYNFSIVIRELMNIVRDNSLISYHVTASNVAIKIIRILGSQALPQLKELLDGLFYRIYQPDITMTTREILIDHMISLIQALGRSMRMYIDRIVRLMIDFFELHLQCCLDIVEAMGSVFSAPDFMSILREMMPIILKGIDDEISIDAYGDNNDENGYLMDVEVSSHRLPTTGQYLKANTSVGNNGKIAPTPLTNTKIGQANVSDRSKNPAVTYTKTLKILQKFVNMSDYLNDYRRFLLPVIIKVVDNNKVSADMRKEALCTLMFLADDNDLQESASRIIHPLMRLFNCTDQSLQSAALTAASVLVCRLGTGFVPYVIPLRRSLASLRESTTKSPKLDEYESLVNRLLKQKPLPPEPSDVTDLATKTDDRVRTRANAARNAFDVNFQIVMQSLETAWALAGGGRNNAADLVGWMKRLSAELIRQSPSPIIRNCASLAKSHLPLATELFNSSFNSIWDELFISDSSNVNHEIPLISSIEMALQSPQIPNNIMIALLNLAEFMELQDKRLPVDVRILARQAEAANMYAKSLRYRELEFSSKNVLPSVECIDALITINNQLGLPDRAAGVLSYITVNYPHIVIEPLWLEKLSRWEDARSAYEKQIQEFKELLPNENMAKYEKWINVEIGKLRCLHALGEYNELESCSKVLKDKVKSVLDVEYESKSCLAEVQRLGANAAWMLGDWSSMDEFLDGTEINFATTEKSHQSAEVSLENNLSFYQAISSIKKKDYENANNIIYETRKNLSAGLSSLLSESYSRAYKAMVTMQILAEMEEVIDYKQTVERVALEVETIKNGNNEFIFSSERSGAATPREKMASATIDLAAKKTALLNKWRGRLKWAPKEVEVYRQILAVHTLVAEPSEDLDSWLELVTLCRKDGMFSLCENILLNLGVPLSLLRPTAMNKSTDSMTSLSMNYPEDTQVDGRILFNAYKFLWNKGEKVRALQELSQFLDVCVLPAAIGARNPLRSSATGVNLGIALKDNNNNSSQYHSNASREAEMFRVTCLLRRADWMRELNQGTVEEILQTLKEARDLAGDHYSVWHAWAVANYDLLKKVPENKGSDSAKGAAGSDSPYMPFVRPTAPHGTDAIPTTAIAHNTHNAHNTTPSKNGIQLPNKAFSYATPRRGSASILNMLSIQQADSSTVYVTHAIKGFVKSIILSQGQPVANVLQDTLRLLTLWFSYGTKRAISDMLSKELPKISPENWLSVIPQLIARIHIKSPEISGLLRTLLKQVAAIHPQALVCPISVALNTHDQQQKMVAAEILNEMRMKWNVLVEEATLVSRELMRVAITPHELWYDGLEQAAQLYMENKDLSAMMIVLNDLHEAMNDIPNVNTIPSVKNNTSNNNSNNNNNNDKIPPTHRHFFSSSSHNSANGNGNGNNNPINDNHVTVDLKKIEGFSEGIGKIGHTTLRDISFRHNYSKLLSEAYDWLELFKKSNNIRDLHQAWEIYQQVFKKIKTQIATLKHLELDHISPALMTARDLILAVPGTYKPSLDKSISITSFSANIGVIASKQRPRRMSLLGSDGNQYEFLLKGHEDLRQDERVMQLFGLINVCLDNDGRSNNRGLNIVRYSVLPLSNNSGLIGWVQNCDTFNQLIKVYREANGVKYLHLEAKLLQSKSHNYDKLTLMQKVEAFKQVCEETSGQDLAKMLWLRSKTSDVWVERRSNFTKSIAVMSMVGYILGLGDRHPSNLMLDRVSGRVVHIDFGDCFEITSQRAKYPEIIPFRLTRMLTNSFEAAGTEGTYRRTCHR
eukprot:gene11143-14952_t